MLYQFFDIVGAILFLAFLPGFLISFLLIPKSKINIIERIFLGIILSISTSITLGIILSFSKAIFNFGELNKTNVYIGLIVICFMPVIIITVKTLTHK